MTTVPRTDRRCFQACRLAKESVGLNHRLSFPKKDGNHPNQNFKRVCCGGLWQEMLDRE